MCCEKSFELHCNADGTWDVYVVDASDEINELQCTSLDNALAFIRATVGGPV